MLNFLSKVETSLTDLMKDFNNGESSFGKSRLSWQENVRRLYDGRGANEMYTIDNHEWIKPMDWNTMVPESRRGFLLNSFS